MTAKETLVRTQKVLLFFFQGSGCLYSSDNCILGRADSQTSPVDRAALQRLQNTGRSAPPGSCSKWSELLSTALPVGW